MKTWLSHFISLMIGKPEKGEVHSWGDMILYLVLLAFILVMVVIGMS